MYIKKFFYWSPFTDRVATVKSVINTNDGPGQKLASGKINIDTIK